MEATLQYSNLPSKKSHYLKKNNVDTFILLSFLRIFLKNTNSYELKDDHFFHQEKGDKLSQ